MLNGIALCAAGRLPQTDLQQVNETSFVFQIPRANEVNHLTVFLTGTVPFPEGYGASVHFQFPGRDFQTLGVLTNVKPSAIYRLRAFTVPTETDATGTLGIQILPLQQLETIAASLSASTSAGSEPGALVKAGSSDGVPDPLKVAERMVKNLFNYIHSWEGGPATLTPQTPIPLAVFQRWYENTLTKLRNGNTGFLLRDEE